ncbi:hypothetical protein Bpfe_016177 [Biomphalaria pfeifferi]|uniref:Uncharacterized protein n=1 Tax=Biomphalaria pfeifferi TaxID=112525 RepID=A0AAD8F8W4_BIOPF|nr:hypothetical protein Bpfe_016177 [Biomphalaria pfeifferi]
MLEKQNSCSIDNLSIFDEEFPDNVSISDLCDCGRHKRQHAHKATQDQHKEPFPKSDYMSTFQAIQHPRPRSSKRPPAVHWDPRLPPMYISTNQKDAFKDLGNVDRVKPIIHADKYEPSTEPLDGVTWYSQEFTPKKIVNEIVVRPSSRRNLIHLEPGQFDDMTTNKKHYRRWVPQPNLSFSELPSFTGSILFPDKENLPVTTTRDTFKGIFAPPPAQMKMPPPSIKIEGDHFFNTTHKSTYKQIEGHHRSRQVVQKETMPQRKGLFFGVTQTQEDFPGFKGHQPRPPKPVDPPQPTIDLKFDNKQNFSTENRSIFRGHDVSEHPAAPSCKKVEEEYKVPSVKFETETSQKRDFQPIDLKAAENVRISFPMSKLSLSADAKFDGRTMNHELFQDWGVQPRVRYGDFHENRPYIPSKNPFTSQSVTQSTFVPKPLETISRPKPQDRPISKSGEVNFKTVYQEEFQKKQARMCRAQVYLIQQELKRRKKEAQQKKLLESEPAREKCVSAPNKPFVATSLNTKAVA